MTIPDAFQREATPALSGKQAIVDPKTGLSTPYFLQLMQQLRADMLGAGRIIPCSATGTNILTLTPNPVSPLIQGYRFGDCFPFIAENNSTGAMTGTVVPAVGSLSTLKLYKTNGAAQAGAGDVVAGLLYVAWFVDSLDSANGGFVLK